MTGGRFLRPPVPRGPIRACVPPGVGSHVHPLWYVLGMPVPPAMLARLRTLIAAVAEHEHTSTHAVMVSLGLLTPHRWGYAERPLTRPGVAHMIESLRRRLPPADPLTDPRQR